VVRELTFATIASLALAGCAVSNTPYPRPDVVYSPATRPPPGPNIYTTAQRAPLHSQLFVCNRWSSNLGEISESGETLLYTPYIDTPAGPLLRNPTEQACLSSGFGWRGALENGRQHNGMDLANPEGGFIYAAGNGRVMFADYRNGFGNTLEIDHGRGVHTFYAHLSEIDANLREGDQVREGQPVARMGMTGNATGVHLHYEVRVDGLLVDPLHYGRPPTFVSAPAAEPLLLPDGATAYAK
jgi:murein DD-endopeptidase MepM/ murein hydrolase activator NlpD